MSTPNPSILYIAYHYPPILGSSGVHRTVAFTRHLAQNGWQVEVLTASLKAYERWSDDQFSFIPEGVKVTRAYGRDVSRHFAWRNKYLGLMALPDNWQSWILGGFIVGLWRILRRRPKIIVSTYPIASAHFIAYLLHKVTGIPWVADLRDPMAQEGYPSDKRKKSWFQWIERKIVKHCQAAVVTAPGAKALYVARFKNVPESFWLILPNGFDDAIFSQALADHKHPIKGATKGPLVLLHSGVIYPSERDPSHLFAALSELQQEGKICADDVIIRLRATGHDDLFSEQLKQLKIEQLVQLEPTVPYEQALQEMFDVDGLLLLQAANCNYQIPAKAYEYIRVQKPVLGLTPTEGDTGQLLLQAGNAVIAPLDNKIEIKLALLAYIDSLTAPVVESGHDKLHSYSRQYQAAKFEKLLDKVLSDTVT